MTGEAKPPEGKDPNDAVRSFFERIGDAIDVTAKSARLNIDIGALNSRRNTLFEEMGRRVYELYGKGLVKNTALLAECANVAELDAQIAQKRAQLAELRGQRERVAVTEEGEEMGIEEEAAPPPTTGEDLTEDEEREIRPPGEKKL